MEMVAFDSLMPLRVMKHFSSLAHLSMKSLSLYLLFYFNSWFCCHMYKVTKSQKLQKFSYLLIVGMDFDEGGYTRLSRQCSQYFSIIWALSIWKNARYAAVWPQITQILFLSLYVSFLILQKARVSSMYGVILTCLCSSGIGAGNRSILMACLFFISYM